jgi:hypothetical protein
VKIDFVGFVLRIPFLASFMLVLAAVLAPPMQAETEVHAVGVYEGVTEGGGRIHGPEVRVLVDRPGAEVILLLASYEDLR